MLEGDARPNQDIVFIMITSASRIPSLILPGLYSFFFKAQDAGVITIFESTESFLLCDTTEAVVYRDILIPFEYRLIPNIFHVGWNLRITFHHKIRSQATLAFIADSFPYFQHSGGTQTPFHIVGRIPGRGSRTSFI